MLCDKKSLSKDFKYSSSEMKHNLDIDCCSMASSLLSKNSIQDSLSI